MEGRAFADSRRRADITAGLFDDAVDGGKAEARADAGFLGGEEGLEDLFHHILRHAVAGVFHLDQHILAVLDELEALGVGIGAGRPRGADRQLAAILVAQHRIARIGGEVEDRVFQLVLVGLDVRHIATMHDFQLDPLVQQLAQEDREFAEEVRHREDLALESLLARIGEQHLHQFLRPHRELVDGLEVRIGRIAQRVAHHQFLIVEDDALQDVVEVVRHAAGELADGLHLFAMREADLQLALVCDVHDVGDRRAAIAIKGDEHVDVARILAGKLQADRLVDRIDQHAGKRILAVFGLEHGRELAAGRCLATGHFHQRAVGVENDRPLNAIALQADRAEGRIVEHRVAIRARRARAGQGETLLAAIQHLRARQQDRAAGSFGAAARPSGDGMNRDLDSVAAADLDIDPARQAGLAVARQHLHEFRAHDVVDPDIACRLRQAERIAQPGVRISDRAVGTGGEEAHRRVFDIKRLQVGCPGRLALACDRADAPEHLAARQRRDRDFVLGRHLLRADRDRRQHFAACHAGLGILGQAVDRRGEAGARAEQAVHGHRRIVALADHQRHAGEILVRGVRRHRGAALVCDQHAFVQRLDPAEARLAGLRGADRGTFLREEAQHAPCPADGPQQEDEATRAHGDQQDRSRRAGGLRPGERHAGRGDGDQQAAPEQELHHVDLRTREFQSGALDRFDLFRRALMHPGIGVHAALQLPPPADKKCMPGNTVRPGRQADSAAMNPSLQRDRRQRLTKAKKALRLPVKITDSRLPGDPHETCPDCPFVGAGPAHCNGGLCHE